MSRTIKIKKSDLLGKIRENKKNHIVQYDEAVAAYKEEAIKKLEKLTNDVISGEMKCHLNMITPVNNARKYDELITQFEMEVDKVIEVSQNEFTEYVHDRTSWAISGGQSNTIYSNSRIGGGN